MVNACFWVNEAEKKADGAWGYELGFGLWASHYNLSGYQFLILQSTMTGLNLPVSSEM